MDSILHFLLLLLPRAPQFPETMVKIDNESDFQEAIKALRADHTETNWVLAAHVDNIPDTIRLTGSGSGGVDQLVASLNESSVMYGIGESDLLPFDGVGFEYNYFPFMAQ